MKNLFKSFGIIAMAVAIVFSLVSCASLGGLMNPEVGSWTAYIPELSKDITYVINVDGSYTVTFNKEQSDWGDMLNDADYNVETGTWEKGSGSPDSVSRNTTITFTKSNGERYTGKFAFNKMTIGDTTYIKQETE